MKRPIVVVLLVGFLFPQGVGSLHYFLVEHPFPAEQSDNRLNVGAEVPYHSCIYHLSGFSFVIPEEPAPELGKRTVSDATGSFSGLENYVHQPDFNFQLRGPPQQVSFQDYSHGC